MNYFLIKDTSEQLYNLNCQKVMIECELNAMKEDKGDSDICDYEVRIPCPMETSDNSVVLNLDAIKSALVEQLKFVEHQIVALTWKLQQHINNPTTENTNKEV